MEAGCEADSGNKSVGIPHSARASPIHLCPTHLADVEELIVASDQYSLLALCFSGTEGEEPSSQRGEVLANTDTGGLAIRKLSRLPRRDPILIAKVPCLALCIYDWDAMFSATDEGFWVGRRLD